MKGRSWRSWEWGAGPTVVLVHGWGSRAGRFGALTQALAEGGFRAVAYDAPAHGRSTGRSSSLPEFARALRAVGDAVGPVHGLVGHSLGGAAAILALRDGLRAERIVLLAAPADVTRFSTAFADHLRLPAGARAVMQRNLETRLQARWDELHLPTIARSLTAAALLLHDREDEDVPYAQRRGDRRRVAGRAAHRHGRARPPRAVARPGGGARDRRVPAWSGRPVIVMDRRESVGARLVARASTTNDVAELDRFRERVGAPPQALQLGNRRYPHLDLKLEPRERALADPEVRVFERTSDMLRFVKSGSSR